jgi:hypothetical protein
VLIQYKTTNKGFLDGIKIAFNLHSLKVTKYGLQMWFIAKRTSQQPNFKMASLQNNNCAIQEAIASVA